ncbi:MAG: hypothetical protein JXA69_04550 [Phycisphaerae bacterium]|nr:hypothetical protein [Phycisphaerae bacterium]
MTERFNNEFERLLAGRLDDDLSPTESERLDALLAANPTAQGDADALARVDRVVREWGRHEPDIDLSGFRSAVMKQVRRQAVQPRHAFRWVRIGVPLAAAAMIVFAVSLQWPATPEPAQPIAQQPEPTPVIQVAYGRPTHPSAAQPAATVAVTFQRSAELEQQVAARQAAQQGGAGFATASGGGQTAPVQWTLAPLPI